MFSQNSDAQLYILIGQIQITIIHNPYRKEETIRNLLVKLYMSESPHTDVNLYQMREIHCTIHSYLTTFF